ncbi:MAG TPA: DUF423 domain-containing protein [Sphingomonas bacterium]|jgi:uncharacterized membrane protein YgdD (TMEM256/DUF423 family)|uniref:DUF423 domain-containing protein n=1 Tax=Sphingomonas bacterium TaxID=1895847 RepID=A0A3D0W9J6_9SPHN|nr:DUF423 domain-containing protein [Sphingomonas bacterium]
MLSVLAAISGAIAIAAGAFGAHGASGQAADWLRTGGMYQLIHAVAVLVAVQQRATGPGWAMLGGAALFSATLYAMALGAPRWFGAITPIGGAAMIAGWLWLAWLLLRR